MTLLLVAGCDCGGRLVGTTGDLEIDPLQVDFGSVTAGQVVVQPVSVRNVGKSPVGVAKVSWEQDVRTAFSTTATPIELQSGQSIQFNVEYAAPAAAGTDVAELVLTLDSRAEGRVKVVGHSLNGCGVGVDLQTDPMNCGKCGVVCQTTCVRGQCVCTPSACAATECGTRSDGCEGTLNCGPCGPDGGFDAGVPDRPQTCGTAPLPFSGALCGPPTLPCLVKRNEILPTTDGNRGDAPSIVVDSSKRPVIAFSLAVGGFHGFLASRSATGAWAVEATPTAAATLSLGIGPNDGLYLLVDNGANRVFYTTKISGRWATPQLIAGYNSCVEGALAVDSVGCTWGVIGQPDVLAFGWSDIGFARQFSGVNGWGGRVTLSATGVPEVVGWATPTTVGWHLMWVAPGIAPESVDAMGSVLVPEDSVAVGVGPDTGAVGTPHVLYVRDDSGPGLSALFHASRSATGWTREKLDDDSSSGDCDSTNTQTTCSTDAVTHTAVAVLVSANGDVRLLSLRNEATSTMMRVCGEPGCSWQPMSKTTTARLEMFWDVPGGLGHAVLLDGLTGGTGRAVVDGDGVIHVALYDGAKVRYVAVGP
jgi:hypothetical protein